MKGYFNFQETGGRELIDDYKNNYAWFGSFGISSGFVNNNIEQIFIVGILILKMGFIMLLKKMSFLHRFFRALIPKGLKKLSMFLN